MNIDRIGHETWIRRATDMSACMAGEAERLFSAASVMRAAIERGDEIAAYESMRAEYRRIDAVKSEGM